MGIRSVVAIEKMPNAADENIGATIHCSACFRMCHNKVAMPNGSAYRRCWRHGLWVTTRIETPNSKQTGKPRAKTHGRAAGLSCPKGKDCQRQYSEPPQSS